MMASTTLTAEARQSYNLVDGNSDKSLAAITTAMTTQHIYILSVATTDATLQRHPRQSSKSKRGREWEDITKAKPTAIP